MFCLNLLVRDDVVLMGVARRKVVYFHVFSRRAQLLFVDEFTVKRFQSFKARMFELWQERASEQEHLDIL
jgi:hypothetical protein